LVRSLAHEATHAIQHDQFSAEQIKNASNLSNQAEYTRAPGDYETYLTCEVELPAHAVMIAVDLRNQEELSAQEFDHAARETWTYRYIAERLNGATNAASALARVLEEASKVRSIITPPRGDEPRLGTEGP
jgi:hypothetical protein